jgi:endonuclease-3 related protein
MTSDTLKQIYQLLLEFFGPQHWWPGDGKFEIMVGAILTQNTNWGNVEKAIANLKNDGSLSPQKILDLDIEELAGLIRPAGYYNIKAKRLKNFIHWFFDNYDGQIEKLGDVSTGQLREELLSVSGIGAETADSILLYALERGVFVVDAYTARVAVRHQLIEPEAGYDGLQYLFSSNLQEDVGLFNEYHALLVRVGKEFCRPKARCENCPLNELPHRIEGEFF